MSPTFVHFNESANGVRRQFRSARGDEDVFRDLWRRVEVLFEVKAPYQTAGAVEYVGEAFAATGRIVDLCAVVEGVNRDASSVNVRDSQRGVPRWSDRIAVCSFNRSHGKTDAGVPLSAGFESEIRICDPRVERQSGRGRCSPDQEGPDRCDQSSLESHHGFFLSAPMPTAPSVLLISPALD